MAMHCLKEGRWNYVKKVMGRRKGFHRSIIIIEESDVGVKYYCKLSIG